MMEQSSRTMSLSQKGTESRINATFIFSPEVNYLPLLGIRIFIPYPLRRPMLERLKILKEEYGKPPTGRLLLIQERRDRCLLMRR